jgi:chromosome segregation ATPase
VSKNIRTKKAATKPRARKSEREYALEAQVRDLTSRLNGALCEVEARGTEIKRLESVNLDLDVKLEETKKTFAQQDKQIRSISNDDSTLRRQLGKMAGIADASAVAMVHAADSAMIVAKDRLDAIRAEVAKSYAALGMEAPTVPSEESSGPAITTLYRGL